MNKNGKIINQLFLSSLITTIASTLAVMVGVIIDGVLIGKYLGPEGMAAYSIVTPVVNMTSIFSGILSVGTQIICAQHLGAGDEDSARRTFSVCMAACAVISTLLVVCTLIFRRDIVILLGAGGKAAGLIPEASSYLLGLVFSLPLMILLLVSNSLMRLDSDAGRVVIAVIVMTILDIAGDLANVFIFHGGLFGMGLATTLSYLSAFIIMSLHFLKKDIIFRFSLHDLCLSDLKEIISTGSSSAVGSVSTTLRIIILNHIMAATALSATAVGAFGVLNTISTLTTNILIGVGLTSAMIAGMILGEQDRSAAVDLVKISYKVALLLGLFIGLVLFILAGPIASAFGNQNGTEMVTLATRGLRFHAVAIILYGINNTFINYTQGMRRMTYSNTFCFLQNFVYIVIPSLALAPFMETDAVWFSLVIGESLTLISIWFLAACLKKGLPLNARDFLFLKEPFGVGKEDVFEVSIERQDQVLPASEAVLKFCEEKHADRKQCYLLSLFVEELGNNTALYGLSEKKNSSLDIRVVRNNGTWNLRLRDNSKAFDPISWLKIHGDEDPTANIGIRMVCKMAKKIDYFNTLNLNILIIQI